MNKSILIIILIIATGVPLVIAAIISLYWMTTGFADDNSRTWAALVIIGCNTAVFLILSAGVLQQAEKTIDRTLLKMKKGKQ